MESPSLIENYHYCNTFLAIVVVVQNIVCIKHHAILYGVCYVTINETNYVRCDAKTFPDHQSGTVFPK